MSLKCCYNGVEHLLTNTWQRRMLITLEFRVPLSWTHVAICRSCICYYHKQHRHGISGEQSRWFWSAVGR